jgi:zinc protease
MIRRLSRAATLVVLAAALLAAPPLHAQQPAPAGALPLDPAVRTGRLDNGLQYFIRRNTEPRGRAELYLALNAGSALEDADQRGLAHFIEHMQFNGTRRFPKQDLVRYLESTGMRFGGDVNAYTSFDETVYTLTVPTDSARMFDRAFDVLEDWAGAALLEEDEIDRERGVIVEEWRVREANATGRLRERIIPALLPGSRYADRLPIGDTATLRRAPYETLRRYYRQWYRPDLMALVVVGDVDVDAVERRIRQGFADLRNPAAPRPRPTIPAPTRQGTEYIVATDPEYPVTSVEVMTLAPATPNRTVADMRADLVAELFTTMLNQRLEELSRRENAPFVGAFVGGGGLVRPAETFSIGAQVEPDRVAEGLEAVLREGERARRHGFTAGELARAKAELLRGYERRYNERERTASARHAQALVQYFLAGEAVPGAEAEFRLAQQLMPALTLEEVNQAAGRHLGADAGRLVLVAGTDRPGFREITEPELQRLDAAIRARLAAGGLVPYLERTVAAALIETPPPPASVAATRSFESLGTTVVTLANGVRVVMKPTQFKADEVRFTATSPGGASRVAERDNFAASVAPQVASQSGVGTFSKEDLDRYLAGKTVQVAPYVSDTDEGFNGMASPADLETLFQLIHLYVTAPRVDAGALAAFQNQQRAFLANRGATPGGAFQDTLVQALYRGDPRRAVPTVAQVDALTPDALLRLYRERFADVSDMTFTFVGNFEVDRLTRLAQQYLGTLPGGGRDDQYRDVYADVTPGVVSKSVYKGVAPQSQVALIYHGPFQYNRENRQRLAALEDVLSMRLREKIREELSGVYGVQVQSSASARPDTSYQFVVVFVTDPQRVDELTAAVQAEIRAVQESGPTAEQVATVQAQQRRERQTSLEQNSFWVDALDQTFAWPGGDPEGMIAAYEPLVAATSVERIREDARRYLDAARVVKVVLYPETMRR